MIMVPVHLALALSIASNAPDAEIDWGPFEQPAATARELMAERKWKEARDIYWLIVESQDPAVKRLRDEILFQIAETYLGERQIQEAAAAYNRVRKEHPDSQRVPASMLKLGVCFELLGLKRDAVLFYRSVIEKFPASSSTAKAKHRIAELGER